MRVSWGMSEWFRDDVFGRAMSAYSILALVVSILEFPTPICGGEGLVWYGSGWM